MSTQVTLTLPDDTYRRAEHLARLVGRDIADVLTDTIQLSLQPVGTEPISDQSLTALTDEEVLTAADSLMDPQQDQQFSDLLWKQQAGQLQDDERAALLTLMHVYQDGLLRKARALAEAVRRGLRPPLEP